MAAEMNPAAGGHPPIFFAEPGAPDILMWVVGMILVLSVLAIGLVFLRLHTLPERIAHTRHKLQFEIVAVLGLLALFTHIHLFWVAGLILALIDLPDFSGIFGRMARALDRIALNTAKPATSAEAENFASKRQAERSGAKGELTDA